ncbi:MAG: lyase, partial [Leptospira sp.]|nr:lyase [Leptospira sp.]
MMKFFNRFLLATIFIFTMTTQSIHATEVFLTDEKGTPLDKVMVTIRPKTMSKASTEDNGYPKPGQTESISEELTKFTRNGRITIDYPKSKHSSSPKVPNLVLRAQKIGYKDVKWEPISGNSFRAKMEKITDPQKLINQYPSNTWLAALDWKENEEHKKVFLEQCGFCHQQGSTTLRVNRSEEDWREIMNRMIGYGSRPKGATQKVLPALLSRLYKELLEHPERVEPPKEWGSEVYSTTIREWPLGDSYSQMHDLLAHTNRKIYVGDNLQDRIWELDPLTGKNIVHKVPFQDGDSLGGLLSGRLKTFPKHETFVGVHSLAESSVDGH